MIILDNGESVRGWLKPLDSSKNISKDFPIEKDLIFIGRHPSADLHLPISAVSRFHAKIIYDKGNFFIEDLGSRNGTYINTKPTDKAEIKEGDTISFGTIKFVFSVSKAIKKPSDTSTVQIISESPGHSTSQEIKKQAEVKAALWEKAKESATLKGHMRLSSIYRLSEILRKEKNKQNILKYTLNMAMDVLPADHGAIMLLKGNNPSDLKPAVIRTKKEDDQPQHVLISRTIIDKCFHKRCYFISYRQSGSNFFGLIL